MAGELVEDDRIAREGLVEELLARIGAGGIVPVEGAYDLAGPRIGEALAQERDDLSCAEAPQVDGEGVILPPSTASAWC